MVPQKSSYANYAGIDVGKFTLEIAFINEHQTHCYTNNKEGWRAFWKEHKKNLKNTLVVLETTGWYERGVLHYLAGKNVAVHRAPARQVKQFIASYGRLAKTDAIDAKALAQYAKERAENLACYDIPTKTQEKLQILYSRNLDLKKMLVQEKNRLQAPGCENILSSIKTVLHILEIEAKKILQEIKKIIDNNPILLKKYDALKTIDGIGDITAMALLASMPELGEINRKQAASLAGLAPHPRDSGIKTGYRKTKGGRGGIKEILNMAALGAIRKKQSKLQEFYIHLIQNNHKKPMVALTAVKRKIIIIANARLAELQINENHS